MECLAIDSQGVIVDTIPLALAILKGRETRTLVEYLTESNDESEIADILGTLIAASRMSGRAQAATQTDGAAHGLPRS
jgi:hypothetical protein